MEEQSFQMRQLEYAVLLEFRLRFPARKGVFASSLQASQELTSFGRGVMSDNPFR
jgi:hypothetical protein